MENKTVTMAHGAGGKQTSDSGQIMRKIPVVLLTEKSCVRFLKRVEDLPLTMSIMCVMEMS